MPYAPERNNSKHMKFGPVNPKAHVQGDEDVYFEEIGQDLVQKVVVKREKRILPLK